jgi:hypothetical protein
LEIEGRFEAIEECYEFMLAYAAQGLTSDKGRVRQTGEGISDSRSQSSYGLTEHCAEAMGGCERFPGRHGARAGAACSIGRQAECLGSFARAVLEARKAGKIRYIGFTGHKSPAIHLKMLATAESHQFRFDTVQMPLNVMDAH